MPSQCFALAGVAADRVLGETLNTIPTGPRPPTTQGKRTGGVSTRPGLPGTGARPVNVAPGPAMPSAAMPRNNVLQRAARALKVLIYTAIPLSLLAMIGLGVVYVRLRHGPISFDVLVGPIERG